MKKTVFVMSHLCSGSYFLINSLNQNKYCMFFENSAYYDSFSSLESLTNRFHKAGDHPFAIYGDHILYNFLFSCKKIYEISKFIYFISPPRKCLNKILENYSDYDQERAYNYYIFRIRRIYEMAKKTPNAVFLNYDNLQSPHFFSIIEKYLNLNLKKESFEEKEHKNIFNEILIEKAENCYEKYFYKINQLDLIKCSNY
jgi:hypothetical protein